MDKPGCRPLRGEDLLRHALAFQALDQHSHLTSGRVVLAQTTHDVRDLLYSRRRFWRRGHPTLEYLSNVTDAGGIETTEESPLKVIECQGGIRFNVGIPNLKSRIR